MIGKDGIFMVTYHAAYPALPDLVAINPSNGSDLWRFTFPCEQDPLDPTACRSASWNHQTVSDSMIFVSAGLLYGINTGSGKITWSYGLTADNWNPLAYADGVLFALNTPNGFSPVLSALSIAQTPIPEISPSSAMWVLAATLLGAQTLSALKKRSTKVRERFLEACTPYPAVGINVQ